MVHLSHGQSGRDLDSPNHELELSPRCMLCHCTQPAYSGGWLIDGKSDRNLADSLWASSSI
jgi:hypothetical protein